MYSKLVEDTTRKNTIEEVKVFEPLENGGVWHCPFCDPAFKVYKLTLPPANEIERLREAKSLIKAHVELHQQDILNKINNPHYDKAKTESLKRVRLWITGTVADRKLYEENPLHK